MCASCLCLEGLVQQQPYIDCAKHVLEHSTALFYGLVCLLAYKPLPASLHERPRPYVTDGCRPEEHGQPAVRWRSLGNSYSQQLLAMQKQRRVGGLAAAGRSLGLLVAVARDCYCLSPSCPAVLSVDATVSRPAMGHAPFPLAQLTQQPCFYHRKLLG